MDQLEFADVILLNKVQLPKLRPARVLPRVPHMQHVVS